MTHLRLRDLALIGDRRTAALLTRRGDVVWYCPGRFDRPSLFAALLDTERGGAWRLELPGAEPAGRRYIEDSAVLETQFKSPNGPLILTDFMPYGEGLPNGICRRLSPAPSDVTYALHPAPDYARRQATLRAEGDAVQIDNRHVLYASHPLSVTNGVVRWTVPAGEQGWAALLDGEVEVPSLDQLDVWLEQTLEGWREVASHTTYRGPYEDEVAASLRALRLLTFGDNGGIIAAPTTSLPEVVGGERNYDYRCVWLRDAGMIVSALTRAGSDGTEEGRFLEFICATNQDIGDLPLAPFTTLDGEAAPEEETLALAGYRNSRPVVIGNGANDQLQLDAYGNVLLAAKLIYGRFETREHWKVVVRIADYLAENWAEPDYGIWEERDKRQYTSSKAIAACGLEFIAPYAEDEAQARRQRRAAEDIRTFVEARCLTSEGAYAAVAGGEAVDVSAALFPVWTYTEPDAPEMLATMRAIERDLAEGQLYRRHLERFDSAREGAFLAGTFWVAQYWIMRDVRRAQTILEAALAYANDLGFFAEEADPASGEMLGNFPQTFVHAAFVGAVIDLKAALEKAMSA
jgi:GH15 family glucan-1,4-alpha-glucosidase